jgi:hypothetical protein
MRPELAVALEPGADRQEARTQIVDAHGQKPFKIVHLDENVDARHWKPVKIVHLDEFVNARHRKPRHARLGRSPNGGGY